MCLCVCHAVFLPVNDSRKWDVSSRPRAPLSPLPPLENIPVLEASYFLFTLKVKSQTRKKLRSFKYEVWSNCDNVLADPCGSALNSKQV